jgi:hypothetical protein
VQLIAFPVIREIGLTADIAMSLYLGTQTTEQSTKSACRQQSNQTGDAGS